MISLTVTILFALYLTDIRGLNKSKIFEFAKKTLFENVVKILFKIISDLF